MNAENMKTLVAELVEDGYAVGLRGQDVEFPEVGGYVEHESSRWSGEEYDPEDDTYDGICALSLMTESDMEYAMRAFGLFGRRAGAFDSSYLYDHVAIVAGDIICTGQDPHEVVISCAEVAGIVA